jgi:hypothetical protein
MYKVQHGILRNDEIIEEEVQVQKWFKSILPNDDQETTGIFDEVYDELFQALSVTAFTFVQNTAEWFLLRIFSCTSSTSDHLLAELKQMLLYRSKRSLVDEENMNALRNVLNVVHGEGWDRNIESDAETEPAILGLA